MRKVRQAMHLTVQIRAGSTTPLAPSPTVARPRWIPGRSVFAQQIGRPGRTVRSYRAHSGNQRALASTGARGSRHYRNRVRTSSLLEGGNVTAPGCRAHGAHCMNQCPRMKREKRNRTPRRILAGHKAFPIPAPSPRRDTSLPITRTCVSLVQHLVVYPRWVWGTSDYGRIPEVSGPADRRGYASLLSWRPRWRD